MTRLFQLTRTSACNLDRELPHLLIFRPTWKYYEITHARWLASSFVRSLPTFPEIG